jgi:hypothetical protein
MRKISATLTIVTCLTILVITGFPRFGEAADYEPDTNRPGMDYHNYELSIPDWTFCKSSCDDDPKCMAWTYVKANTTQGPQARCWLKSGVPEKKTDTSCISGVKPCPPINVSSPVVNNVYYINEPCPIRWDTSNIKNYGTVFLYVVQYDLQHLDGWEGGGFPVSNTGNYQWTIPANIGPLEYTMYAVKVVTQDKRCVGMSGKFTVKTKIIKKMVPMEKTKK